MLNPENALNSPELSLNQLKTLFFEPKPIPLSPELVLGLRHALEAGGLNLELSEPAKQSLKQGQFRNWKSGRGPGLSEALGSRRNDVEEWLKTSSEDFKMTLGDNDKTRGAKQFTADLVALAIGLDIEATVKRINARLFRSWLLYAKKHQLTPEQIKENFSGVPERGPDLASFDPEILPHLIDFLAGKPQN